MREHIDVTAVLQAGVNGRRLGRLMGGAILSGAMAVEVLAPAGVAHASCVSFSGLNSGGDCTSTIGPNVAVAIGPGATATAVNGFFGTAIAVGNGACSEPRSRSVATPMRLPLRRSRPPSYP